MVLSKNYSVYINGNLKELEKMRVSKMPFNRHWPGHQRSLEQTEVTAFLSFELNGETSVKIVCDFDFKEVCIKPSSLGIVPDVENNTVSFTLNKPCQAVVEFDGTLGALHLFANAKEQAVSLKDTDIYFAPGEHDVGTINLKSGQTMYISEGAVVYGEIYAEDVQDITICGRGILDHSRIKTTVKYEDVIDPLRPSPIEIRYSKNVVIRDIIVRDPCFLAVRPICCDDLLIDNIKIIGCWRYNSDGIDLINCRRGLIKNCFIRSFDDSVCLKGFHFPYQGEMFYKGRTYDTMEDILFENCVVWNEWGNALHIGIDSCAKAIKNCTFSNCDIIHSAFSALNITTVDYPDIYNIVYEDIRVEYDKVSYAPMIQETEEHTYVFDENSTYMPLLFMLGIYKNEYSFGGVVRGKIHDVVFKNISITAPKMPPNCIEGYSSENGIQNVLFENLTLNNKPVLKFEELGAVTNEFIENVTLKGVNK